MPRRFDHPPGLDEIEAMARAAMAGLPEPFAGQLGAIRLSVEDEADPETLAAMGIDHPLDLTGLYEGVPLNERSADHSGTMPDRVRLFRRAILDEWLHDDESLEQLVAHIVIHEIGHHFGLSDEAMHRIEDEA